MQTEPWIISLFLLFFLQTDKSHARIYAPTRSGDLPCAGSLIILQLSLSAVHCNNLFKMCFFMTVKIKTLVHFGGNPLLYVGCLVFVGLNNPVCGFRDSLKCFFPLTEKKSHVATVDPGKYLDGTSCSVFSASSTVIWELHHRMTKSKENAAFSQILQIFAGKVKFP